MLLITINSIAQITQSGGNVGISKKTPQYKLDVNGAINATEFRLNGTVGRLSQWTTSSSKIYYNTGEVGIGTNNPIYKLHVLGSTYFRGSNTITLNVIDADSMVTVFDALAGDYGSNIYRIKTNSKKILFDETNYGYKIGIGKTSPNYKLDVNGSINGTSYYLSGVLQSFSQWQNSSNNIYFKTGNVSINNNRNTVPLTVKGTTLFYDGSNNPALFEIGDTTTGTSLAFFDTQGQRIIFNTTTSGAGVYKMGIGTDAPTQSLDVVGNIKTSTYLMQQGIYAGIYVADASTAQSIANGTTYTKSTAFTTNGNAANCTSDATNDKITITKTGKYLVNGTCSFSSGTSNVVWKGCAFLNGIEQSNIHWARKVGSSGDVGSASFMGTISVTSVPVDLDMRFRHDQGSATNITVQYANMTVIYLGE